MSTAFVELDQVTKKYGDHTVLDRVDLAVDRHEVVTLIGASGSGKSTLLRCVNGLETIQGGQISIVRTTLAAIAIAMIPNGFVLSDYSTSWQYVAIGVLMIVAVVFNEGLASHFWRLVARTRRGRPETSRN